MEILESEQIENLIDVCRDWLRKKCGSEVRSFPLYDGATEVIADQATPQIYEELCAFLNGECRYENRISENHYRLLTVKGKEIYVYYTAAGYRIRILFGCNVPPALLTEPIYHGEPVCESAFHVLNMHYELQGGQDNGLGLVLTLEDGSFLIYDGGFQKEDGDRLFQFLSKQNSRQDGILVSAWILTHGHEDHYGAFYRILQQYGPQIQVCCFLFNPVLNCREGKDFLCSISDDISRVYPDARKICPHSGMQFRFCGFTVEVLFTHEDILPLPVTCFNDASTVTKITASNGVQCLLTGDIQSRSRVSLLQNAMREYLKSDILQVPHHGDSGGTEELYRLIDPHTVIYSTSQEKFKRISQDAWILAPNSFLLNQLHVKEVIVADVGVQPVLLNRR